MSKNPIVAAVCLLSLSLFPAPSLAQTVTFTDARDGKQYKSVKMPDGKTWMAANLNYKPSKGNSWCYGNKPANCEKYGRLYDLAAAEKACPKGYRLPFWDDWQAFAESAGLKRKPESGTEWTGAASLKTKSGWKVYDDDDVPKGTDVFGFSAQPGGSRCETNGIKEGDCDEWMGDVGRTGKWWASCADEEEDCSGSWFGIEKDEAHLGTSMSHWGHQSGYSVRCVQDVK